MKILKLGKLPKPPKPFWAGVILTCPNCSASVLLEEGDKVYGDNPKEAIFIHCPTKGCDDLLKYRKPKKEGLPY